MFYVYLLEITNSKIFENIKKENTKKYVIPYHTFCKANSLYRYIV